VSVDCPLDCEFLQEAHKHERVAGVEPADFPHQDIHINERFLRENEWALTFLARSLLDLSLRTPGVIDFDVREALDALARTYRTLQSGIYYESRPTNPIAAGIYAGMQESVERYRQMEREQAGMTKTGDAALLGIFVFLQRLELDRNNNRKRGRAFIDFLRGQFAPAEAPAPSPSPSPLIVP